jgi:mRNA-degrading endonuclease RelE of RelBE toxin-antitoxin system
VACHPERGFASAREGSAVPASRKALCDDARRSGWYDLGLKRRPFRIEYSPRTRDHLAALNARQRATILDKVDVQLAFEPTTVSRNRKPLQVNPLARYELRIGDLRVYYEVDERRRVVEIRAVGVKDRNRVLIGGEEVDLS